MASLTLDWLHIIVLLGAVQGVLLAGVLAARRRNRTANRLLAALMLAFSLGLSSEVYYSADLVQALPHFFGLSYPLPFLYGPLVYLYAVTAADRSRRLTRWDALHFVPFLAVVIAGLPIYLMSGPDKVALFHQLRGGVHPPLIRIVDPLKYVSGVSYTGVTIVFLRRHHDRVKESYSSLERVNLRWLLWLGAGAAAIWLLAVTLQVLESAHIVRIERPDNYIALAIAALVYGIGYSGLRQPEIFRYETAEYPVALPAPGPEPEDGASRYERSGLTEREAQHLRETLAAVMDRDTPWRDSELTLADLATRLSTTPHKLSEVLNAELGQSFYDFVNGHRVREVQRRIEAGDARQLTILSLALDAGFASKSTFNLVFKKHTGRTPSEFRQAVGV
ncbi:MAG TPA: helix-turn-helix domain-containing protein [Gemmatimonadales bacterium]|nr:helix-turn-helix domain-containing protein [Gemmatimonadales bacterium]